MKYLLRLAVASFLSGVLFVTFIDPATVSADESSEEQLDRVVVTANRIENDPDEVGSAITTIDHEAIARKQQSSVLETLRTVPGLEVVQQGGRGRVTSIFIRGAESDHTLVLVDGIRVNSTNNGAFDFADLQSENIERIEVLRGPQSVLYGSEAIGGVINIITRKASEGVQASASAQGGSHTTQEYVASLGYGDENFHSSTAVSFFDTDGISAAQESNGNTEDDGYENVSVSTRTGLSFLEDGSADLTLRYTSAETDVDDFEFGVGPVDALNAEQERDFFTGSFVLSKPLEEWVTPTLEIGYTRDDLDGTDPDSEFNNFDIDSEILSTTGKVDFFLAERNILSTGYTFENRKGENEGSFDETRDVNSLFLQDQHSFDEWLFLTGGVRYDDDSDFGDETTYRVSAAALISESGTRFHGSYGTGFKAPSFNELYFPNFGNPDLDAETSWGYDVGIEQNLIEDQVVLDVTFFQNDFDDLITFDPSTFVAENIEEGEAYGIESTLTVELGVWGQVVPTYTYTESENKETGALLPRRPRHRGTIDFFLTPIEKLDVALSLVLVNDREDADGSKMDNYERVDLAIRYEVEEHFTPFVRFENLFDDDYEEIPGYGTPGFVVFGGLEVRG